MNGWDLIACHGINVFMYDYSVPTLFATALAYELIRGETLHPDLSVAARRSLNPRQYWSMLAWHTVVASALSFLLITPSL